jgi:Flp pilus assembly protein TadD
VFTALIGFVIFASILVPPLEPEPGIPQSDQSTQSKAERPLATEDLEILTAASIEFQSGQYQRALVILEEAATKSAPHPETLNLRGATLVELGRLKEAEQVFGWVLEIEPTHFWASYNLAEIALLNQNLPEARKKFLVLPTRSPAEDELVNLKALLIDLRSSNTTSARTLLPPWPPASAAGYAAYAAMAQAEGEPDKRKAIIDEARSLHPEQFGSFLKKTLEESGVPVD